MICFRSALILLFILSLNDAAIVQTYKNTRVIGDNHKNGISEAKSMDKIESYHERTHHKNHHRRMFEFSEETEHRSFQKRRSLTYNDTEVTNNTGPTSETKPAVENGRICIRKYNKVAYTERNKADDASPKPQSINYDYDGMEYTEYDDPQGKNWSGTLEDGTPVEYEKCAQTTTSCYALWQHNDTGNITILGQGCWETSAGSSDDNDCSSRSCMHAIIPGAMQKTNHVNAAHRALPAARFCCCTGDSCNAHPETTVAVATKSSQSSSPVLSGEGMVASARSAPMMAAATFAAVVAFGGLVFIAFICRRRLINNKAGQEDGDPNDFESHGEGSSNDPLATGLACVDNLKIMEHIGSGRFGSVWRGTLGSKSVAVKIFPNGMGANHWQREKDIYMLPHIRHANILKYYGSDNRQNMSGGREALLVVELASLGTLRSYLREGPPLQVSQFVDMAFGLASAVAHLHTHIEDNGQYKACVAHRDINSNNVLVRGDLSICLADFGLAMVLPHPHKIEHPSQSSYKITEAGTIRYLSPEALEGALDLRSAGAALRAVDVYALALVLWELLWRVAKTNREASTPAHQLPYQHAGVPEPPTLEIMQSVVSRRKIRPPLPRWLPAEGAEARSVAAAAETCAECWDQDAEARLTAVCVRERFADARLALREQASAPRGVNRLKDPDGDDSTPPASLTSELSDKNSNCALENLRQCEQRTPLLYPLPHQGRNPCLERNLATVSDSDLSGELFDKSLKDTVTTPSGYGTTNVKVEECLSVARGPSSNRVYSYNSNQESGIVGERARPSTPIDYVQNDVSLSSEPYYNGRVPIKQVNITQDARVSQPSWGLKRFFGKRNAKKQHPRDTEVKLDRARTGVVKLSDDDRTSNVGWSRAVDRVTPPNQTASTVYRELPARVDEPAQVFAVIVPKAKYVEPKTAIELQAKQIEIYKLEDTKDSIDSIAKQSVRSSKSESLINLSNSESDPPNCEITAFGQTTDCSSSEDEHIMLLSEDGVNRITMQHCTKPDDSSISNLYSKYAPKTHYSHLANEVSGDNPVYVATFAKPPLKHLSLSRQHSLEQVGELFSNSMDLSHLRNPSDRVKTPGDVPPSVRRIRRDRTSTNGMHKPTNQPSANRLSLYDDRMMFGNSL